MITGMLLSLFYRTGNRHREVKEFTQGHTARFVQSQDSKTGSLVQEGYTLIIIKWINEDNSSRNMYFRNMEVNSERNSKRIKCRGHLGGSVV